MSYLLIAIGSALGGMARYWCTGFVSTRLPSLIPWGTILVNVVGSFLIGAVLAALDPASRLGISAAARENLAQFFMVGVLGGYTTFSSFSLQTLNLMREQQWTEAGANVLISVAACLIAVGVGFFSTNALTR